MMVCRPGNVAVMTIQTPAPTATGAPVAIDADRLWSRLMELGAIGAYADELTGLTGVNRLALTDADAAGRHMVVEWMRAAGLEVTVDEMGNLHGRREGRDPGAAPVRIGSHIDTVATAGAFDGCLGVLGGIEVLTRLAEEGIVTHRPIIVSAFTEEEGVRFGTDMLGSAVAAGRIPLSTAYGLRDGAGRSVRDELERTGFLGTQPVRLDPPYAYLECHIEQGPVLLHRDLPIGVVTGVQAISWQRVTLRGRAAHAGTTPTELRIDAGLAAAELVVHLREMVDSGRYAALRATCGQVTFRPGLANVVPHTAEVIVDLRNPDDEAMARAEADLTAYLQSLRERHPGLGVETTRLARTAAVPFDTGLQSVIEQVAGELGHPSMRLMSGAGHDAQEMAAIGPAAMVFVRGQHDGISHNPREFSTPEDCAAGVTVLVNAVVRLASMP